MNAESKDVVEHKSDPFVEMIERLATNEAVDPDKMQKLVDLQIQIMDRNARDEFYAAMSRVQAEIPSILPDSRNEQTHSDYASLKAISVALKPIITSEGFSASFWQGKAEQENHIRVEGILRHSAGHSEPVRWVELEPDKVGIRDGVNKTNVHAAGSTFTYGRRYLKCMMFDITVGGDLDGNQPSDIGNPMEYMQEVRDHFDIIAEIKLHILDGEEKEAVTKWRSLGPDVMAVLWKAPTKGGVFSVAERKALTKASKENPDQAASKAWQDKFDADSLQKELDAQAKAEESEQMPGPPE
ncbi:MAG: ERF family protein [Pseudomonadales bacterium]